MTLRTDPPWFMHTNLKIMLKSKSSDIWSEWNWIFVLKIGAILQTNANISAFVRDNPSTFLLRVSALKMTSKLVTLGKSRHPHTDKILLFRIHLWAPEPQEFWSSTISNGVCTTNTFDCGMLWTNKYSRKVVNNIQVVCRLLIRHCSFYIIYCLVLTYFHYTFENVN